MSICFVTHNGYASMAGTRGHIGGVERQTSLMARWFAAKGYRVSMLTWDEGQPDDTVIDGVRVIKMCREGAGIKGLRFFHPRWTSLNRAMHEADADLYYQNCAEYVTGQVALWCRRHGRRFVYSVASEPDCDARLPNMGTLRERFLYRYGLRHADRIIVQTRRQQEMLEEGFHLSSAVLPMPCPGPSDGEYAPPEPRGVRTWRILWIGRVCEVKQPQRLLDIAGRCSDLAFDLVGPGGNDAYSAAVLEQAKALPNVVVHGAVARDGMPEFYCKAALLCCTSDYEGFPNTFLEAWSHGLPVVSTFDPDGLIAERGLGIVADDVAGLAAGIRRLLGSPDLYRQSSQNARRYYLENHAMEVAMPRFERLFLEVLNGRPSGTGA